MRIGVFFPTGEQGTLDEMAARITEQVIGHGLASAWFPQSKGADALTAIAAIGQHVNDVEFGTSIVPTYPRHPVMLAVQALTANAAVRGRLTLGIGVSHKGGIEHQYDMSYEKPARHMRDYLSILGPLMRDGKVDHQGPTLTGRTEMHVPGADAPPVLVAALQPMMLKLAGGLSDGTITWCTGPVTVEQHIVPVITEAARDAGRRTPRVVVALPVIVTGDEADGRAKADAQLPGYARLPVYRAVLDREGAATPGDVSVVGDASSVAAQLRHLGDIGATDFVAILCGTPGDRQRTLEALSDFAT